MAKYYKRDIKQIDAPGQPPSGPLRGHQPAKRSRIKSVMSAQDKIAAMSRRIVGRFGISGATDWLVPSTDPTGTPSQTHPNNSTERPADRFKFDVTPGCFLSASIMAIPSGETQIFGAEGNPSGPMGRIVVNSSWTDREVPSTISVEHSADIEPSQLQFAGAPTVNGGAWDAIRVLEIDDIQPEDLGGDVATLRKWCQHVTCAGDISQVGGCRIIDVVLYEQPYEAAMEADDSADRWTHHLYSDPAMPYPLQRADETTPDGDPRHGTWHLMDVNEAQQLRLGPLLLAWSAYSEDSAKVVDTDVPELTFTSTAFQAITNTAQSAYDETEPGWSISCGGYARSYRDTWPRQQNGAVPVRVQVYARAATGSGVVRVQASPYSWVEVAIDGAAGWYETYGHLRTGKGPGDPSIVQAFAKVDTGGDDIRVRALRVYKAGQFAPAA